jgi:hypothetical protein
MKSIVICLVVIGVIGFGIGASKDLVAKGAVQGIVHSATGLELKIKGFHLGLLTSLIDIRGLQLLNPYPRREVRILSGVFSHPESERISRS